MIAEENGKNDLWSKLSAPLPAAAISWRQDGKPVQRDGKFVARFVAYVDAQTVRDRLDSVVPGEWDLTLELLPTFSTLEGGEVNEAPVAFKARLQILGVIREDVGSGRDYKSASTDAFKRAAVRFGIAHELYSFEQNWVQVDGDGRYAKPLEDPQVAYDRRMARQRAKERLKAENGAVGNGNGAAENRNGEDGARRSGAQAPAPQRREPEDGDVIHDGTGDPKVVGEPDCPKCGGRMWDNRLSKRNPKAPDYKCRNRSCDGCIWPVKQGERRETAAAAAPANAGDPGLSDEDFPGALEGDDDDLPF
jgi:hypothetical protein